ncbi:MAG: hemolysin III family protein, partial [Floccifex sp.]
MEKNSMKYTYPLSFSEEVGNSISHGVMGIILLVTLPFFAIRAYLQGGWLQATGISVYFICLFFMFMGSCLYHTMPRETTHKFVFRKIDHIMILLAIAGTYTPICLIVMHNWIGYIVLAIEWMMALAGILLKSISNQSHPKLSMTIYMIMGWLGIFVLP